MPDAIGNVTLRDLSTASGFSVRQLRYLESRYRLLSARPRPRTNREQVKGILRELRRHDEELLPYKAWRAFLGERVSAVANRQLMAMARSALLSYRRHYRGVTKYYAPRTILWVKKLWAKAQEGLSPAELKRWANTRFDPAIVLPAEPPAPKKKSKSKRAARGKFVA